MLDSASQMTSALFCASRKPADCPGVCGGFPPREEQVGEPAPHAHPTLRLLQHRGAELPAGRRRGEPGPERRRGGPVPLRFLAGSCSLEDPAPRCPQQQRWWSRAAPGSAGARGAAQLCPLVAKPSLALEPWAAGACSQRCCSSPSRALPFQSHGGKEHFSRGSPPVIFRALQGNPGEGTARSAAVPYLLPPGRTLAIRAWASVSLWPS